MFLGLAGLTFVTLTGATLRQFGILYPLVLAAAYAMTWIAVALVYNHALDRAGGGLLTDRPAHFYIVCVFDVLVLASAVAIVAVAIRGDRGLDDISELADRIGFIGSYMGLFGVVAIPRWMNRAAAWADREERPFGQLGGIWAPASAFAIVTWAAATIVAISLAVTGGASVFALQASLEVVAFAVTPPAIMAVAGAMTATMLRERRGPAV